MTRRSAPGFSSLVEERAPDPVKLPTGCEQVVGCPRNRAIDGLRGAAILAVVFVHTAHAWPVLGRDFIQAASLCRYGVDLFFVLSGWVLTHLYFSTPPGLRPNLAERLRQRTIRLTPLYWLGILAYGVTGNWWGWATEGDAVALVANATFVNSWNEDWANAVVPGGWSISVEFWSGAALLVILPWLSNVRRALAAGVAAWVISRLWPVGGTGDSPWMHLPSFMLGAAAWQISHDERGRRWLATWSPLLPVLAATALASLHHAWLGVVDRAMQAGGASFLLVLWAGRVSWRSRGGAVLAWLGTLSYGLYLVHFAMIELAVWVTVVVLPAGADGRACGALSLALTFLFSVPAAWWLDRRFDRPVRHWIGRRRAAFL